MTRQCMAKYRPISLTCILCKVMEHIVASNLAQHLNKNDIFYGLQHGFREKLSSAMQLIKIVEELDRKLNNGREASVLSYMYLMFIVMSFLHDSVIVCDIHVHLIQLRRSCIKGTCRSTSSITKKSTFEAITRRLRRQSINRTCKIRLFTHLKVVWYRKLDLKNIVFIDRNMVKTGVLY